MYRIKVICLCNEWILDIPFYTEKVAEEYGIDYQINHEYCYGFEVIKI